MPTAAQRQRLAALAQLNQQHQQKHATTNANAQAQKQQSESSAGPSSSADTTIHAIKPKPTILASSEWDDGAFSDEDSDDDALALEMDGQDSWTQNFCATCDTLIEPGQGLIGKREEAPLSQKQQILDQQSQDLPSPTSSMSRASSSGLKSKSGTIKARPTSSDETNVGAPAPKRTNSAGRIHAVGGGHGTSALGPSKRTGSAGSRLNALSELKPTTKLHNTPSNGKGKQTVHEASGPGPGLRSPASSRRSSTVSLRSTQSGGNAMADADRSMQSSPNSPSAALPPRINKKSTGLLGHLTPAALKEQEECEAAKSKAPAALYCSERCRQIDEQRSEGLGELVYYLQQPAISPPSAGWQSGPSSYGAWSSRASASNMSAMLRTTSTNANYSQGGSGYGFATPESECACAECLEKNSASGTVPSGASDTTESSNSYQYGSRRNKQRSTSGRIVTPQNIYPPGVQSHVSDYFGRDAVKMTSSRLSRQQHSTHRHRDSLSVAGTESSTRSSDSGGSEMWEPRKDSGNLGLPGRARGDSEADVASVAASELGRGSTTTGTVTPDGIYGSTVDQSAPQAPEASYHRDSLQIDRRRASLIDGLSTSQASTTSPLRLLRHGDHRGSASVDVNADVATSPQPYSSSLLSRSLASERTEGAASSGFTTLAGQPSAASSFFERRQNSRPMSRLAHEASVSSSLPSRDAIVRAEFDRFTDSPMPFNGERPSSAAGTALRAVGTLKNAQARTTGQSRRDSSATQSSSLSAVLAGQRSSNLPASNNSIDDGANSTGSGWLRNSISAAWNTIRGSSSSSLNMADQRTSNDGENVLSYTGSQFPSEEPTPTQSLIKRPTIKRGDVPAFASEIGRGEIPGERDDDGKGRRLSQHSAQVWDTMPNSASLSKSFASAQSSTDLAERKQQRKAERERAHRHQRSKDVSVLPPLLGIARPGSSANLHGHGLAYGHASNHRAYSSTNSNGGSSSRSDVPDSPLLAPVRSTTPGLMRGSHAGSFVGLQDLGTSPGRAAGMASSYGTSPRRAGLGWGVLTPLGPPSAEQRMTYGAHPSAAGNRMHLQQQPPPQPHHHHHHHHASSRHAHEQKHPHGQRRHHHHGHHHSVQHVPSRSHLNTMPLHGSIGVLGAHPHGHAPIAGRHATTPVRMSTPRVPEDGGEMTGAQLKGEDEEVGEFASASVHSRSFGRRSLLSVPPRPRSVNFMRPQHGVMMSSNSGLSHGRTASSDDGSNGQNSSGTKLYPVLDVPNRAPTHDNYDAGWGLGNEGLSYLLSQHQEQPAQGEPYAEQEVQRQGQDMADATLKKLASARLTSAADDDVASHASSSHLNDAKKLVSSDARHQRKKLFYFDTS